jgi:hypothetical protein
MVACNPGASIRTAAASHLPLAIEGHPSDDLPSLRCMVGWSIDESEAGPIRDPSRCRVSREGSSSREQTYLLCFFLGHTASNIGLVQKYKKARPHQALQA